MPVANKTSRTMLRGNETVFSVAFFADSANTTPLVPLDSLLYPAYTIYDPENQQIQSGVGQATNTPGQYRTNFLVPVDAKLSNDQARWRIEWSLVDVNLRQVEFVEEFEVRDVVITASETREQKFISLAYKAYRCQLRLGVIPEEVNANVYVGGNLSNLVTTASYPNSMSVAVDGDSQVFYFDIAPCVLQPGVTFTIIWEYRFKIFDPFSFVYQTLTAVTPQVLENITSLRMLIDKFQKRLGTAQAYEDSDLNEYLVQGQNLINAAFPTTYFPYGFMPNVLGTHLILQSAWYGLNAQGLLSGDLGINFSGASATFDYDNSSVISETIGRWQDYLTTSLPAVKTALVRRGSSVGTVAGRGTRMGQPAFTYKVASYNSNQMSGVVADLNRLGLIW